jgi:hypothetical protein
VRIFKENLKKADEKRSKELNDLVEQSLSAQKTFLKKERQRQENMAREAEYENQMVVSNLYQIEEKLATSQERANQYREY